MNNPGTRKILATMTAIAFIAVLLLAMIPGVSLGAPAEVRSAAVSGDISDIFGVKAYDATHFWGVGGTKWDSNFTAYGVILFYDPATGAVTEQYRYDPGTGNNGILYGVYAVAANDVWAVGGWNTTGTGGKILRYNGTAWAPFPLTDPTPNLSGVAAADANNVWVCGYSGAFDNPTGEIFWWNGSSWHSQLFLAGFYISSIFALDATHVWAFAGNPATGASKILVYNSVAHTFSEQTTLPTGVGVGNFGGEAADNIWAACNVGGQSPPESTSGAIYHWNGSSWSEQYTRAQWLEGIYVKGSDVWASGEFGTIVHSANGGASWSVLAGGTDTGDTAFHDADGYDASHVWVSGGTVITNIAVTNTGSNVSVSMPAVLSGTDVGLTFSQVTAGGSTTAVPQNDPSVGFRVVGGTCTEVQTTATYAGKIQVRISYDPTTLTVSPLELRLMHKQGGNWVDATKSVDTVNHWVVGEVDSLSPFVLAAPAFYFAEGTCRPGFDPYITVQNPSGIDASVKITYMLGDGNNDSQTFPVAKLSRVTIPVKGKLGEGDDVAHDFSAKVESSTPGADIIAERPMYFNYQGWTGGSCVIGAAGPSPVWYFAEGTCRPGFDPYITVQNPSGTDASVKITYMLGDGNNDSQTFNVAKLSRVTIPVKVKLGEGDDVAHDFSAKVESLTAGADIIAERPMYFNYNGWTGGSCVVGAPGPASTWYFAEGTCRPGFDPYITVQNPSGTDASVKITYMLGDGNTASQTLTVGAHSRQTVRVKDTLGEGADVAHDFSAKVESLNAGQQLIIAERPMYFNYQGWTGGSCVVGSAAGPAPAFYFAEGTCRPGFDPYITVQNPSGTDASVKITYMLGDGSTQDQTVPVGAHSRQTVSVKTKLGQGDDVAHDFSAKVESLTPGADIIAERPMYFNYQGWDGGSCVIGYRP